MYTSGNLLEYGKMSKYVKDLRKAAELLEAEAWTVSAGNVKEAADRMERMEKLIIELMREDNEGE